MITVGIGSNELVAVLVPDFHDFVAHQISVEHRDFLRHQVVKEDFPVINLFGFHQVRRCAKLAPEKIQHQLGQGTYCWVVVNAGRIGCWVVGWSAGD